MSDHIFTFVRIKAAVGTNGGHCLVEVRLVNGR